MVEATLGVASLAIFVGYFGIHCFRYPRMGDHLRHVASVASLYRNFAHPSHEAMALPGTESEVHTPYIVGVAAVGIALGLTPYGALEVAGVLNLAFYAWAVWFFFRTFSIVPRSFVPPVAFVAVSLFLRNRVFYWASETSFASMRLIQSYPSLFGWAIALTTFALAERYLLRPRLSAAAAIALLLALLVPSHNLTASWVAGILVVQAALELTRPRSAFSRKAALALAAAAAAGPAVALLWPYFEVLRSSGLLGIPEGSEFGVHPFRDQAVLYAIAVPAAVAFLFLRRHVFWLVGFLATYLALEIFRRIGFEYGNRYAFFQALFAQAYVADAVGLAWAIVSGRSAVVDPRLEVSRVLRFMFVALAIAAIVLTAAAPIAREESRQGRPLLTFRQLLLLPPTHGAYYSRLGEVARRLHPGDVVLMPVEHEAWNIAAITGASVVASPFAYRAPDYLARVRDVSRFFVPALSRDERLAILRRWEANKVLVTPQFAAWIDELTAQFGPPVARAGGFFLFAPRP